MKIQIDYGLCVNCKKCVEICPANVYEMREKPVVVDEAACTMCGVCADQCPKGAIKLVDSKTGGVRSEAPVANDEYVAASASLVELLGLKKSPVAIKMVTSEHEVPDGVATLDSPVRHCVSINMAAHGAVFYLPMDKHACAAAKAALGMAELPEKVRNGTVPYMHGLAATQDAAARTMAEVPKMPAGSSIGTILAPLEKAPVVPDVVVLTVNPKQAMWVANAYIFAEGGPRLSASFAGMQASCADATTVPLLTKNVNFTVGCYGCRSAGKLADDEMYVGFPVEQLNGVVGNLKGLRKAMGNLARGKPKNEVNK